MQIGEFADALRSGDFDGQFPALEDQIRRRRSLLASMTTQQLMPGDTVRFSERIRPRYLVGKTATVVRINRAAIVVTCPDDASYGRFQNGKNIRCPNELIAGPA